MLFLQQWNRADDVAVESEPGGLDPAGERQELGDVEDRQVVALVARVLYFLLADVQVAVAEWAGDHDAVGPGPLGGGEDVAGELEHHAGAREGEVGAAALQPVTPGDRLGPRRRDDVLHDAGSFGAVQLRHLGGRVRRQP